MKIALIAAGAGGMLCGSCLRDNALARALIAKGHQALLIPTYTPLRTDEENASIGDVFYGGINVYLQQNSRLFRHTPRWMDAVLDAGPLLRAATRGAGDADPKTLVDLTLSILAGEQGNQRKELERLVRWLKDEVRPEIVNLPNELLAGLAAMIKRELGVPVVCTLSGGDVFVDEMETADQQKVKAAVRQACSAVDAFISTSHFYADYMAAYYGLPRERIHVAPTGISLDGYDPSPRPSAADAPFTIGFLARICRQKGLHVLADAFIHLRTMDPSARLRLRAAGYMAGKDQSYLDGITERLREAGCIDDFEYVGEVDRNGKLTFLKSIDVFSVPAVFLEPKGIYVLEALASGVPVVQPRHAVFPELLDATQGGVLVEPNNAEALAHAIHALMQDEPRRMTLARQGAEAVHRDFSAATMADATLDIYRRLFERA